MRKLKSRYNRQSNTTSCEEQDISPEVQNPIVSYSKMQGSAGQHLDMIQHL